MNRPAPLRIGILGVARIGGEAIVLPARALGHRLVAVASRDRRRAEFFAQLCGVERVAGSYTEVLDAPDVDVVYIPQVPALHEHWTLAAIAAGKHVLCEKPLCTSAPQAERVRAAARSAGVHVHEAHHHLCHPLWARLHDYLGPHARRDGPLGELVSAEVDLAMPAPEPGDPRWSPGLGGGVLFDLGCYGLQVLHLMAAYGGGRPSVVSAADPAHASPVETAVRAELRYPGGATAAVRASMIAARTRHRLTMTGTRAQLIVDGFLLPHLGGTLRTVHRPPGGAGCEDDTDDTDELFAPPTTYTHQLAHFARLVRRNEPAPWGWSLDDSVAVARSADAVREAAGREAVTRGATDHEGPR